MIGLQPPNRDFPLRDAPGGPMQLTRLVYMPSEWRPDQHIGHLPSLKDQTILDLDKDYALSEAARLTRLAIYNIQVINLKELS